MLKRLAVAGGYGAVFIGIIGILGWVLHIPVLTSFGQAYIPIALSTCVAFIVQGSALILYLHNRSGSRSWVRGALVVATTLFGSLTFVGHFVDADLTLEGMIVTSGEYLGRFPVNRMSPLTGLLFFLSGTGLLLLLRFGHGKPTPHLACALGTVVGLTGLTGTIAYGFGAPLLYDGSAIPMALSTSVAFMLLGAGLAAATGPASFLMRPLVGDSVRALLLRAFLPLGFMAVIVSGVLLSLVNRSNTAFVSAACGIGFGIILVAIIARAARKIGSTLEQTQAERRRAEDALRESEGKFKAIFDNARDGILLANVETRKLYLGNPAICEMLGYSWEELSKLRVNDIHPEEAVPVVLGHFEKQAGGGSGIAEDIPVLRKNGSIFLADINALPIVLEGKRYLLGLFRDVSRRRHGEDALRESRNLLAKAQEIARLGHWKLNLDTYMIEGSEELFRIFGLDLDQVDLETFVGVVHPEQRNFVINTIHQAIAERRGYDIEHRLVCPDGSRKFIRAIGEPILNDKGELAMMVGTVQDITDRKRAGEERAKMATVIEQAADGIMVTDKKGNIEYVNPAFERFSGYGRQELLGRSFGMFRSEQHHDDAFYKSIWSCISRGETWSGHLVNRMKEERTCEFDATISPIRDSAGSVIGFVSVNRDVTHEVKLERQLRQAQKMEAIGTLAGGISHDFNNILGIIIGYAEIALLDAPAGSPIEPSLKEIHRAAERARDLVRQILAFSRKGEQKRAPLRVSAIVKEALKFLRPALPATIEIHQQLDQPRPDGDIVIADPTQVHQVLMNLCTNAAQAMGEKGGVLHVGLSRVELSEQDMARPVELGPGEYIRLKVSDTGHGMDHAVLERIFEPYFTTKPPGEGTGLGLAVVHGIVKSHSGAITVYSAPEEGTTFHVYLPAAGGQVSDEEDRSQTLPRGTEAILFVDDEVPLANAGKQMLEFLGYQVESRTGGFEALQAFRATPDKFDLIVTDMTMPQVTGLDLAKEALLVRPEIPIIVCTGFSSNATPEKVRAAGVRRLMMKPLLINELARTVREVLDEQRLTDLDA